VKQRTPEIEIDPHDRWVKCATVCNYLDISDDTVLRRAVPWQDDPIPFKFRYKEMTLDAGGKPEKRYWLPDVVGFLRHPPTSQRSKKLEFTPVFHM
jgi:hypothetical protein